MFPSVLQDLTKQALVRELVISWMTEYINRLLINCE